MTIHLNLMAISYIVINDQLFKIIAINNDVVFLNLYAHLLS